VHRLDGRVDAPERGHQDDRRVRPDLAQLAEQLDARAARHADVGEHGVALEVAELLERLIDAPRGTDGNPVVLEERRDHLAHGGVVVDDQDGARFGVHENLPSHDACRAPDATGTRFAPRPGRVGEAFGHDCGQVSHARAVGREA
jgi:hypothetical protein